MKKDRVPSAAFRATIAAAGLVLGVSACGADSDGGGAPATAEPTSSTSVAAPNGTGAVSGEELPEGFPDDIPLPEDATLRTATAMGAGGAWRLMYVIDSDDDDRLERYAARLAAAGFEINADVPEVNIDARRSPWKVDAVVRPPTITLQVLELD